jgi:hypothetical protein
MNTPLSPIEPDRAQQSGRAEGPRRPERMEGIFAGSDLPLGKDPKAIRQRIEAMEHLLERSFVIPGINRPVGLDALAGLIPVIGDFVGMALGAYIVWEARNLGLPKWKLWRMAGNVGFDSLVGAVPVAGDLFDFMFRSNTRNLKIVRKHLDKHHPETRVLDQ